MTKITFIINFYTMLVVSVLILFPFVYSFPNFRGELLKNISVEDLKDEKINFKDELNKKEYATFLNEELEDIHQFYKKQILKDNEHEETTTYRSSMNRLKNIRRKSVQKLNKYELKLKNNLQSKSMVNETQEDNQELIQSIAEIQHDIAMADALEEKKYRWHESRRNWEQKLELVKIKNLDKRKKREQEMRNENKINSMPSKINEPGSEDQLREIWERVDGLEFVFFNFKTFFNLHDLNQDGHWDIEEIEAIVYPGIQKYLNANKAIDVEEQFHEIIKMRQHFMSKIDVNKDHLISLDEFEKYTGGSEYKRNDYWKGFTDLGELNYSDDDIKKFEDELESFTNTTFQTK